MGSFVIWSKQTGLIRLTYAPNKYIAIDYFHIDYGFKKGKSNLINAIKIGSDEELIKSDRSLVRYLIGINKIPDNDYIYISESPLEVGDTVKVLCDDRDRFPIDTIGQIVHVKNISHNTTLYTVANDDKKYGYLKEDLEKGEWVSRD